MDNDLFDEGVREKNAAAYVAFRYLEQLMKRGNLNEFQAASVRRYLDAYEAGEEKCRAAIRDEVA